MRCVFLVLLALVALSCVGDDPAAPIGFVVSALDGEGIPDDLVSVAISLRVGSSVEELSVHTLSALPDEDMNGRPEIRLSNDRILPPYGTPFELTLVGRDDSGNEAYAGSTGTVVLAAGQRRIFRLAFYRVNGSETVARGTPPSGRILHTMTPLLDGRVLISGGFDQVTPTTDGCGADESCYAMRASTDAWLFDPSSGIFSPVTGSMLAARGGHSADVLPDGRVLIAGGAASAVLRISPDDTSFDLRFEPESPRADFELFDPTMGAEVEDVDADGDPLAGRFTGGDGDPSAPGALNDARFLHASAVTAEGHVLLAGGFGEGSGSFEVFDAMKPGGGGVYDNTGRLLQVARTSPAAVTLDTGVWIIGGADAASNDDIAEVWTAEGDAAGATRPATDLGFGADGPHPEFALHFPTVAAVDGDVGLVVGWYGPRCEMVGAELAPTFTGTSRCPAPVNPDRNFSITAATGVTASFQLPSARTTSFASAVRLDQRIVVTGGSSGADTFAQMTEVVPAVGAAPTRAPFVASLGTPRAFHRSVSIPNGFLTLGGIALTDDAPPLRLLTNPPETYHQTPSDG